MQWLFSLQLLEKGVSLSLLRLIRNQQTEGLGCKPKPARCVILGGYLAKRAWEDIARAGLYLAHK
jgi:hypothetical protein